MIADFLIRPYVCAIVAIATVLFLVVDELEPNRRLAVILQCAILATGGGAILRPETRNHLKNRGLVIYLRANPHDLWQRTRRDKNRPLLQTDDPRGKLEALYRVRDPLYQECAHFVVETGRPTVNNLVNMVLMQLEMAGITKPATS